jgi:hypothetical protein
VASCRFLDSCGGRVRVIRLLRHLEFTQARKCLLAPSALDEFSFPDESEEIYLPGSALTRNGPQSCIADVNQYLNGNRYEQTRRWICHSLLAFRIRLEHPGSDVGVTQSDFDCKPELAEMLGCEKKDA